MENELDPKYQDLLFQLCDILKNPKMPAALQHLSSWDKEQTNKESLLPPATSKPSLLQRMDELNCSEDLRTPLIPLEEATPQKRPRSPLSSESSVGNTTGNPGVSRANPYPYPLNPYPRSCG